MRALRKNQQTLYYSLYLGKQDAYKLDDDGNKIVDRVLADGTIKYVKTGKKELSYSVPSKIMGNISFSNSGEVQMAEFGLDLGQYDAVLTLGNNDMSIAETSLIWYENEPEYKDTQKTIVDENSADYKVLKVKPSLNYTKYILGKLTK